MTKPLALTPSKDDKQPNESAVIAKRVGENILVLLGRPSNLAHVQVKRLWECSYRVNILLGATTDASIQHSYFVKTTDTGEIVTTNPRVRRLY